MRIVDAAPSRPQRTTLNDIPKGQVFSGSIRGALSKTVVTGVFYKVAGRTSVISSDGNPGDVLVVRLSDSQDGQDRLGFYLRSVPVDNYVPLDVELRILGTKELP